MVPTSPTADASKLSMWIAPTAAVGIVAHVILRSVDDEAVARWPLIVVMGVGGIPLVVQLLRALLIGDFGSDLLAGVAIVTSAFLGEYLAGSLVVLMLSGGQALEQFAVRRASSALAALARRAPSIAHRRVNGLVSDIGVDQIAVGDTLVVFPHENCPVDGTVLEGHGNMDESYLTGEPFRLPKAPGAAVLSGAVNGETAIAIRADRRPVDSRFASIMRVMQTAELRRPHLRRLGDQLGAWYTPLAIGIALAAGIVSGDAIRFLAVLVIATPCPLLIAIPVAVIGTVSLAARRGIIIKDPAVLERSDRCRVGIFDKTGTLTYGRPSLTEIVTIGEFSQTEVLVVLASLERYSKHPLAGAVLDAATAAGLIIPDASEVREEPGRGLVGVVNGRTIAITGRAKLMAIDPTNAQRLPPETAGLECVVCIDGHLAATVRFRDQPRPDGNEFVTHLSRNHGFERVLLVSGDRETEVRHLAEAVGIREVFAAQSPEDKLTIVRRETSMAPTLFVGDGINDAPALTAATVGLAFGRNSDVTAEAAAAVILDGSLRRVDEFLHIGRRLRRIALQSVVGMGIAAAGYLPPVAGAVVQEMIDVAAVLNALRAAMLPRALSDY